jgi:hypothetical protein
MLPPVIFNDLAEIYIQKRVYRKEFDEYFKTHFSQIRTTPNGNCLYNAISIVLIGDERLNTLLRLMVLYAFKLNFDFINDVIRVFETNSINFYANEAARNFAWGRDIHLFVLSLILKRPIYTFSCYDAFSSSNGQLFDALSTNDNPIMLSFVNQNHWEAVVPYSKDYPNLRPAVNIYNSQIKF